MTPQSKAELSVVLVTPDRYDRLKKTIEHLRRQTVKERIELVIGAPSLARLEPNHRELSEFAAAHLVEIGPIRSTGEARALASARATAPIIAFGEDHCWPEAGWAQSLVQAHQGGWAGVGATLLNANPGTVLSWASLLLNFGPCVDRCSDTASSFIPWHNSAYKGSLLRSYGDKLGFYLEAEGLMHADLEQKGHKLCVAAGARTAHLNVNTASSVWSEQYWGARLFWGLRTRQEPWGAVRRIAFAAMTPGLLIIRVARAMRESRRVGFPLKRTPALIAALWAGSLAITAGAIAGMLLGEGQSLARRVSLEFDRRSYLQLQDRVLLPDG